MQAARQPPAFGMDQPGTGPAVRHHLEVFGFGFADHGCRFFGDGLIGFI